MATELDRRGAEVAALAEVVDLGDAKILEVGSGDGRLTYRYAGSAGFTVGIDPSLSGLFDSLATRPRSLRRRLGFVPACALALPFRGGVFDRVVLAWSL